VEARIFSVCQNKSHPFKAASATSYMKKKNKQKKRYIADRKGLKALFALICTNYAQGRKIRYKNKKKKCLIS